MTTENHPRKRAAYGLPTDGRLVLDTHLLVQQVLKDGINDDGSLTPAAIRALLKYRGVKPTEIASQRGCSDQYVHFVIDRVRRDMRVEDLVAEAIGMDADRIFARRREPAA